MLKISNLKIVKEPMGRILIRLAKAGLSSIVRHMLDHQFGMISSDRGERTPRENKLKHNELKQMIRLMGYGYIKAKGAWKETDEATGLSAFVSESTLFVPNIDELTLRQLAQQFDQEAYVYGQNGYYEIKTVDGRVDLAGKVIDHFQQVYPEKDDDLFAYTGIKGRYFQLDKERPERLQRLREKGEEKTASIQPPQYYFYSFAGNPKYISRPSGISSDDKIPHNDSLEAWIPLC